MRILTLILCTALPLLAGGAYATEAYHPEAMESVVLSESPTGMAVSLSFPDPEIRSLDRGDERALYVDLPGAVPDFDREGAALPRITKLVAVPAGCDVRVHVRSASERRIAAPEFQMRDDNARRVRCLDQRPVVEVGEAGWMRWLRVAPVVINPARYDEATGEVVILDDLLLEFEFTRTGRDGFIAPDPVRYWSLAYEELFLGLLLNPAALPSIILPGGSVVTRGSYVIITDNALANITTQFADWKRAKGFEVVVKPIIRQGLTSEALRDSILTWYRTWDRPPEYVMLLGDYNAPGIQIPAFRITNPGAQQEVDVTDLPYSLLEGDDYFPDLFIGRVSADSPNNTYALNVLTRSWRYEQNIANLNRANFRRATLLGGNFGEGNREVLSPVETVEWLAGRLRERNWDVETFYYRRPGDNISPDPIVESINRGVNIVAYRGWGDSRGTHYPQFYKENLDQLSNPQPLPVMTFFVCNSGDYGNQENQLCFGEHAIARGTRANSYGALAFLGPSDLHTNTRYNNPALGGYYFGLLYQNLRSMAQLTLRSKLEIWASHPAYRGRGEDNFVEFYFSVYNILGDPEVSVYLDAPTRLTVNHPAALRVGQSEFRVTVANDAGRPVRGALLHLDNRADTDISMLTDADGVALAPLSLLTADTLFVTVIAHQAAPYRAAIAVGPGASVDFHSAAIRNGNGGDELTVGSPVEVTVSLKNYSPAAINGVTAALSSPLRGVTVDGERVEFGDIAAGAAATGRRAFSVTVEPEIGDMWQIPLRLAIRDGSGAESFALFRLGVNAANLMLTSVVIEGGSIQPGETKTFTLSLQNRGADAVRGVQAFLHSFDEAIEIPDAEASFGNVAVGATADCSNNPFRITVREGTAVGRQVALRMRLQNVEGQALGSGYFNFTVGDPGPEDPVGPDGYGYYAYDEGDTDYEPHPTFDWIELDPAFGGSGATLTYLEDDETFVVELPFEFRFYGDAYRHASICSNGWISLDSTTVWDFNNWPLPSPLGPNTVIAPFWEDLIGPVNKDSIKVFTRYDADEHRYIVEWSRAIARSGNDVEHSETFQVILFDPAQRRGASGDGEILFQYLEAVQVDRGTELNYATVGIEDWHHYRGLQVSFANHYAAGADTIKANRAILITTTPPDGFAAVGREAKTPVSMELGEPYPNPFNSTTRFEFTLPAAGDAKIALFDLHGRKIRDLSSGSMAAGRHRMEFSGEGLAAGVYLLRLELAGASLDRKVVLIQ